MTINPKGQAMNAYYKSRAMNAFPAVALDHDTVKANEARLAAAQDGAYCKRGPNKGHLKAQCPPSGTDAAIFWQAVQWVTNPLRVSIAQLVFLTDDQRFFFALVEALTTEAVNRKRRKIA
jgi:hypothetical protein